MKENKSLPILLRLSDFDIGVTLGAGSFGRIRLVTYTVGTQEDVIIIFVLLCVRFI
jgi:hypothetical protein